MDTLTTESTAVAIVSMIDDDAGQDAVKLTAERAYIDDDMFAMVFAKLEESVAPALEADINTKTGEDLIRSTARRLASAKVLMKDTGDRLKADVYERYKAFNALRDRRVEAIQELQDRVRKPLTAKEEKEAADKAEVERIIEKVRSWAVVTIDDTAAGVRSRAERLGKVEIDAALFGKRKHEADAILSGAVDTLTKAAERLDKQEAAAEEARKQAEENDRLRAENERFAAEAREREEAARREEERVAAEKASEERARVAAEEAAKAERERVARAAEDALRRQREEHEAELRRLEAQRLEEERLRNEEAARKAAEEEARRQAEAKRLADEEHRARFIADAVEDFDEALGDFGEACVKAIIEGRIRHVTINF